MAFDVHSLEGYSTIASVSGTNPNLTIVVFAGDGAKFGNPQNVTIWPANTQPTKSNSTIGRISGIATDSLTVTTAQEGSSNITVTSGMQIANTITPKALTDIENVGQLGYAQSTSNFSTTNSTPTYVTGLGVAVTIPTVCRAVKVTVYCYNLAQATVGNTPSVYLYSGTSAGTLTTALQLYDGINSSALAFGFTMVYVVQTPAAGSIAYSAALASGLNGDTATMSAGSTAPMFILAEVI